MDKKILVTGAIGFIGYHLTEKLIAEGYDVIGIDNINAYYDVRLKYAKLPILGINEEDVKPNILLQSNKHKDFKFAKIDIKDRFHIEELFRLEKFDIIVNLAAQAGVQYSIENPHTYVENNITGFINLIDAAKTNKVKHFIYASSSSVYGNRDDVPFKETDNVDNPISLYAASKKANELIAHSYSHLYNLKTTGLRFFTVYGPWGRPDMAPFIFVKRISECKSITVFNNGNMERDFTYIDDIINGIMLIINDTKIQKNIVENPNNSSLITKHSTFNIQHSSLITNNSSLFNIYNIGNSNPVNLNDFIHTIEDVVEKKAIIEYKPMRVGDVVRTYSDISELEKDYGYNPKTNVESGLIAFNKWYKEQINN